MRMSLSITAVALVGAALEAAKTAAIAAHYGSGAATDAFFIALLLPNAYAMLWVSACSVGLLPVLAVWLREDAESFPYRLGRLMVVASICSVLLSLFLALLAQAAAAALAPG